MSKAPGRNVDEDERHTVRVVLRLPPSVAEDLRGLAIAWGCPVSATIAPLIARERRKGEGT